jgi:hypothetical protein
MFAGFHKDRGRILLSVWVRSQAYWLLLVALIISGLAAASVALAGHRSDLSVLPVLTSCLSLWRYVLSPRLKFYENGVEIPPSKDGHRGGYLSWDQVERWSWDGGRLILTGKTSVLAGGPFFQELISTSLPRSISRRSRY